MGDDLRSVLIGTAGLTTIGVIALLLFATRTERDAGLPDRRRLQRIVAVVIAVQIAHFIEESLGSFHIRFPSLLQLTPWSIEFFMGLNVAWIVIWVASTLALHRRTGWALFPIWFLAVGSALNGIAHPAMTLIDGGYFPGLLTSPLSGIAGIVLLRRLTAFTDRRVTSGAR